ncbi:DUF7146 domain-containing protein [Sphingomonas sp. UYP23]
MTTALRACPSAWGDRAILFHCFAGCTTIEVLKALQRRKLHDRTAVSMPEARPKRDMGALALRLWKSSQPIAGTLAEEYLLERGLSAPFPKSLRFNPETIYGSGPSKLTMPAMIAAVENDLGVVAVQRTFLDPDNVLHKPMPKPKVSLGLLGTAAIRLAPATDELGFAEGIEDALSAMEWFGTPTWALGGVERLAFVAIPEKVRRIIVYGDRGRAVARQGARPSHRERSRVGQPRARTARRLERRLESASRSRPSSWCAVNQRSYVALAPNGSFCHTGKRRTVMASMNISLPDPMRDYVQERIDRGRYASVSDYVRDLIRRDQSGIEDEERWLHDLDVSIGESLAEMNAGGGVALDAACDAVLADLKTMDRQDVQ